MKASLARAAATFNALPVQMAQLAEALRVKREAASWGLLGSITRVDRDRSKRLAASRGCPRRC